MMKENRSVTAYYRYQSITDLGGATARFRGPIRVIVFCIVTICFPCLLLVAPLYIRYHVFQDVVYNLGESDFITVDKPISTFWCEGQDLWMNATFNAYLLDQQPQISEDLQQLELDKHMQLADDSLEYWGFFLLQGSKVILSVCSRFDGARLMVVKGTKNLKHCALLDPSSNNPDQVDPWEENVSAQGGEIKVTFQQGEYDIPHEPNNDNDQFPGPIRPMSSQHRLFQPMLKGSVEDGNETSPVNRTRFGKFKTKKAGYRGGAPTEQKLGNDSDVDPAIQTAHESMKVNRHRHRHNLHKSAQTIANRTKRNVEVLDEYGEDSDEGMEDEEDEEDDSPNPVGNEPSVMELENHQSDELIDEEDIRSSGSSFAKNLWSCYGGDTLFTQSFSSSLRCQSQDAMMKYAIRMRTVHEITSTGYYYYIFYSDNDIVSNDIFARFNIEKVVYSFPNYTSSCLNTTYCSLNLSFLSSEKVLLEVPLQDGVSDEDALAQMILISTCRPRLAVYFVFPVAILFLILCCAFM